MAEEPFRDDGWSMEAEMALVALEDELEARCGSQTGEFDFSRDDYYVFRA